MAAEGKIYYLKDNMSVYRMLDSGARLISFEKIKDHITINHYDFIRKAFSDKGIQLVATIHICTALLYLIKYYFLNLNIRKSIFYIKWYKNEYKGLISKSFPEIQKPINDLDHQFKE